MNKQPQQYRSFFVAGEASGDHLAAWYAQKMNEQHPGCLIEGIGGESAQRAGITLYRHYETLNVVGIVEVIKHIPRILAILWEVVGYIIQQQFNEVVLIDFPGFNLRLASQLKRIVPTIKITYLSPPQLWCWGSWRLRKLRQSCDDIIVLYPFEVAWYRQRGVRVRWCGNPIEERMRQYYHGSSILPAVGSKMPMIALLPGSRVHELATFMPLLCEVMTTIRQQFPEVSFVIPASSSACALLIEQHLAQYAGAMSGAVTIVADEEKKMQLLRSCCLALSKPGTVMLELALLGVPTIMFFKTSALSYAIGSKLVTVKHMALPNLLLDREVVKECIQGNCSVAELVAHVERLYRSYLVNDIDYRQSCQHVQSVRRVLGGYSE